MLRKNSSYKFLSMWSKHVNLFKKMPWKTIIESFKREFKNSKRQTFVFSILQYSKFITYQANNWNFRVQQNKIHRIGHIENINTRIFSSWSKWMNNGKKYFFIHETPERRWTSKTLPRSVELSFFKMKEMEKSKCEHMEQLACERLPYRDTWVGQLPCHVQGGAWSLAYAPLSPSSQRERERERERESDVAHVHKTPTYYDDRSG